MFDKPKVAEQRSAEQRSAEQNKRKGRVVLSALLAMMLIPTIVAAGLLYWLSRSAPAKQTKRMLRSAVEHYEEFANAPGAKRLRRSGCDAAYVVNLTLLHRVFAKSDGGLPATEPELVVLCSGEVVAAAPSCDDAARIYLAAGPRPKKTFGMVIQDAAGRQLCSKLFDSSGKALGPYHRKIHLSPPVASSPPAHPSTPRRRSN